MSKSNIQGAHHVHCILVVEKSNKKMQNQPRVAFIIILSVQFKREGRNVASTERNANDPMIDVLDHLHIKDIAAMKYCQ
jgi:hypothetical protein